MPARVPAPRGCSVRCRGRVAAGQLELPEAIAESAQMIDLAKEKRSALLCYERDPGGCHRTLLLRSVAPEIDVVDLFA